MEPQAHEELSKLSDYARQNFSHAYMSDTKWRKFFAVIRESGVELVRASVKFIDVDEPKQILFNDHWPDVRTDACLDTFDFGVMAFREIEWLEFPDVALIQRREFGSPEKVHQDLKPIQEALEAAGQFPLELTGDALRLVAYRS